MEKPHGKGGDYSPKQIEASGKGMEELVDRNGEDSDCDQTMKEGTLHDGSQGEISLIELGRDQDTGCQMAGYQEVHRPFGGYDPVRLHQFRESGQH